MTIKIASLEFDRVDFDAASDVLYLGIGEPRIPADSYGTPEGHNVRYDASGAVVGLTLVGARSTIARDGAVKVTIPIRVPGAALEPAFS